MGCASSKSVDVKADVYRPAPSSFAVFDIDSIKEPWLMVDNPALEEDEAPEKEKAAKLPETILDKLNKIESTNDVAPHSTWNEVSKALEDVKATLNKPSTPAAPPLKTAAESPMKDQTLKPPTKNLSFHTLEELDKKLSPKPEKDVKKADMERVGLKKLEPASRSRVESVEAGGRSSTVKENIFILRDRQEREKEGKMAIFDKMMSRRDPLSDFPDICPPRGENSLVIYTTSLHGVRRTFEECNRARTILEVHRVVFDERDVALHGEYRNELKELLGDGAGVPRIFIKGRYLGGVDELVEMNEAGRFGRLLRAVGVEFGVGRQLCEGCGGARFVPCLDCGGSCKVVVGDTKERCGECNENGLVHCPACL